MLHGRKEPAYCQSAEKENEGRCHQIDWNVVIDSKEPEGPAEEANSCEP